MKQTFLGDSDLILSPIGIGAWAMGGAGYKFAWGHQNDEDSIAAIHRALDLGVNWIDTAAVYGLGHSEEVVGRALRQTHRKPYVFTKCERVWHPNGEIYKSLKRESIRNEVEQSLKRLQVDVIDLYQIHWPEPQEDIEEGWSALIELKREGKVRNIGVCNFNAAQLERAMRLGPVTSLQPPYSMLRREIEQDTLPYCQQKGIGVIAYSPMASGLLTGSMTIERVAALPENDWRSRSDEFKEPRLSANLLVSDKLKEIGLRHEKSAGEVAIAWTLAHPAVTGAIVGVRSVAQVDGIIGAMEFRLSLDELDEIEEVLSARIATLN